MTGVVLSGGESRRMGTDKGLLIAENKSWVKAAYDKLSTLGLNTVISVNSSQLELYAQQFERKQLVADNDSLHINGPLHGLLSVHLQFPSEDLLVLACDMIAMDNIVLAHLHQTYKDLPGKDCYVFQNDNGAQPLAGIYTASLLYRIFQENQQGQLQKFSMKHVLETSNTHLINIPVDWEKYFVNYNFKEDIDFQ